MHLTCQISLALKALDEVQFPFPHLMKMVLHLVRHSQVISAVYLLLFAIIWAECTSLSNLQEI